MTDVVLERFVEAFTELAEREGLAAVAEVLREAEDVFGGDLPEPIAEWLLRTADELEVLGQDAAAAFAIRDVCSGRTGRAHYAARDDRGRQLSRRRR